MTPEDAMLVRLLAFQDALWRPYRFNWSDHLNANVTAGRMAYQEFGVVLPSGGGAGRVAFSRTLADCEAGGLLTIRRAGKVPSALLTDEGELRARGLAGVPELDSAVALAGNIIRLAGGVDRWLSEWRLFDPDGDPAGEARAVAATALPGCARGWLVSRSDPRGLIRYHAGGGVPLEADYALPADLPGPDEAAVKHYHRSLGEALDRLRSADPPQGEIGMCPLSCSTPDGTPV
jgi:hypothetical protein